MNGTCLVWTAKHYMVNIDLGERGQWGVEGLDEHGGSRQGPGVVNRTDGTCGPALPERMIGDFTFDVPE